MTRTAEAAKMIQEFRAALGLPRQQDLANVLNAAVTAVSAWERGDYEPKAENYLSLGNLAVKRGLFKHAAWFWFRAGIDESAFLVLARGLPPGELDRLHREARTVKAESAIPEPPAILPPQWKEKWRETYAAKLSDALDDELDGEAAKQPENVKRRHWKALREANKLLRTPDNLTYEQAKALEDWQVIHRSEEDGVLKVVTIDAKKYRFPVPKKSK